MNLLSKTNQKVAILGRGVSGRAADKLLSAKGVSCDFYDKKNRIFTKVDASSCSLVVQSPGFKPDHEWLKIAEDSGLEIVSEVDLGVSYSNHSQIVAITGTNGKTSLTSVLGHVFRKLKTPCFEAGNIGTPLSEAVADDLVEDKIVFHETSSFQAVSSKFFKPDFLLWTNFAPDHLDYHCTEKEYFLAKLRLANNCKTPSQVFIGTSVIKSAHKYGLDINPEFQIVVPLSPDALPQDIAFFYRSQPQLENLAFAICWSQLQGISKQQFFDALQGCEPFPHRLQKVNSIKDVCFWNDSKSTNLASTLAACKSFTKKITWIGGGKSKGQNVMEFASSLSPYLQTAFLIGETAKELSFQLTKFGIKSEICQNLKTAVQKAYNSTNKHGDIVFSPGFASFDMFSNYIDRGNSFESLVFDLKSAGQVTTKRNVNHLQAIH